MYTDYNKQTQTMQIQTMQDTKKSGKKRDWRGKKSGNLNLSSSYSRLGMDERALKVKACALTVTTQIRPGEAERFHTALFCQDRLCPICNARRAELYGKQINDIMEFMKEKKYRYVFITLTQRNVPGEELSHEMDKISYAFNRLTKMKEFKAMSKGWIRGLEVTHNWARDDYHPHLHIIVAVEESYFNDYENWLSQNRLSEIWTKLVGQADDNCIVDIRRVRRDKEKLAGRTISYSSAISEISKYATKGNDWHVSMRSKEHFKNKYDIELKNREQCLEMTDKAVSVLHHSLFKRRLMGFGGCFREARKILNQKDIENGDLNEDTEESDREGVILKVYRWNFKLRDYFLVHTFVPEKEIEANTG